MVSSHVHPREQKKIRFSICPDQRRNQLRFALASCWFGDTWSPVPPFCPPLACSIGPLPSFFTLFGIASLSCLAILPRGALPCSASAPQSNRVCLIRSLMLILLLVDPSYAVSAFYDGTHAFTHASKSRQVEFLTVVLTVFTAAAFPWSGRLIPPFSIMFAKSSRWSSASP